MSAEEQSQGRAARQRWLTIGVIVLGVVIVAVAVIVSQLPSGDIVSATPEPASNVNKLSMGEPDAPATIDVFEDFQCPACKYFTEGIETLVIQNLVNTGKARYVYHNYPFLDGDGAGDGGESDQAANASMCAAEQDKFWEMHNTIYANWNGENMGAYSDPRLHAMAQSVGLDMPSFKECFNADEYQAEIQADFDLGRQMGVQGTPSVFVNGKKVGRPGYIATYEEIVQAVEAVIAGQ